MTSQGKLPKIPTVRPSPFPCRAVITPPPPSQDPPRPGAVSSSQSPIPVPNIPVIPQNKRNPLEPCCCKEKKVSEVIYKQRVACAVCVHQRNARARVPISTRDDPEKISMRAAIGSSFESEHYQLQPPHPKKSAPARQSPV